MKKILAAVLCLLMIFSIVACGNTQNNDASSDINQNAESEQKVESNVYTGPQQLAGAQTAQVNTATVSERNRAEAWIMAQINNNNLMSFKYDGKAYKDHIGSWAKTVTKTAQGWNVTYTKNKLELLITILYDAEFGSLEWVGTWTNRGSSNTGVISEVMMIDSQFDIPNALVTSTGGETNTVTTYQPITTDLGQVTRYQTGSYYTGRAAQQAWPWFDIMSPDQSNGVMLAIGWGGTWKAIFNNTNGKTAVAAGMNVTNYYMKANETLTSPTIVIQFFDGNQEDGHNAWRQLMLKSYTPTKADGTKVTYAPITINTWGGWDVEKHLKIMNRVVENEQYFEYQWIDAGWYGDVVSESTHGTEWAEQAGNWYFSPGYPNGFKELNEWHDANGTDILVWFEPGRAVKNTKIHREHPSYFLPTGVDAGTYYYDFGNVEACNYMINLIIGLLDEMDCDFYRQDYNFTPLSSWEKKDAQESSAGKRVGVTELKYVAGHYRFLQAIKDSGRQIDNCASGGCLLEINMCKLSIPLWRTDYTVGPETDHTISSAIRSQGAYLSWWIPIHGGMPSTQGANGEYGYRSLMGSGATMGVLSNISLADKLINEMVYNRDMFIGDMYILRQGLGADTDAENAGYQFQLTDGSKGFFVCFRPTYSSKEYTTFYFRNLDANATYEFRNVDNEEIKQFTGEQLMNLGLKIYFPREEVAHMIYFTKK